MPIARKLAKVSNYKFMCAMLYIIENGCKWRALPKKYGKWHTVYVKFNRWFKNGTIAKSYGFFFFKTLSSVAMKKQKLLNEWDSVLFIDSASIKASPDANENRNGQNKALDVQKKANNEVISMLYIFCLVIFHLSHGNSHGVHEVRKLIKSIYPKNNTYLLVDRAYENDKTLVLAEAHGFITVVPPKKIVNYLGFTINSFINNKILLNNFSFV